MTHQQSTCVPAALLAACCLLPAQTITVNPGPQVPAFVPAQPAPTACANLSRAWVEPSTGNDFTAVVGSRASPFQTLQAAINAVAGVVDNLAATNPGAMGIVYALPGVYGPTGLQSSTDALPIRMRNRVHVQGAGARRCILRGTGVDNGTTFWPSEEECGTPDVAAEILVDFYFAANPGSFPFDTEEMLDGFTFQGGDVQVLVNSEAPVLGRISNCLFDMRHGALPGHGTVAGPFFGIQMVHVYELDLPGYHDHPVNILNNTFVLGDHLGPLSRPDAVAIIDVNDPACWALEPDPDPELRGVGNPSVQNNLVRSLPSQPVVELMGLDGADTRAATGTFIGNTNAFHRLKVGGDNGIFYATISGAPPLPRVSTANLDPGFMGEVLGAAHVLGSYRDYRIMPDSAVIDRGSAPAGGLLTAANGTTYLDLACAELSSFQWDGEGYGNPRIVGGEVDLGFDEVHLAAMAGGYANEDASHNLPPGPLLHPSVTSTGGRGRYVILPPSVPDGTPLVVLGTNRTVNLTPAGQIRGWTRQPGTTGPTLQPGLPADFRTAYLNLQNPDAPTPWTGAVSLRTTVNPVQPSILHVYGLLVRPNGFPISDNEGLGAPGTYFNTQTLVLDARGNPLQVSNLQSEYR
ncbi:MAG: hypothetical protein AAF628_32715 [Planctomycetota bacterium]